MTKKSFKKISEKLLFECFENLFFPVSDKFFQTTNFVDERPDIDFSYNGYKIGLELTYIFQDSQLCNNGSKLKENENAAIFFTHEVIRNMQKRHNIKFCLAISFNSYHGVGSKLIDESAHLISNICNELLLKLSNKEWTIFLNSGNMPKQIHGLNICRYDELTEPQNSTTLSGELFDLTREKICKCINDKEEKLNDFRKMDLNWLLIVEGYGHAGSFSSINSGSVYITKFDRIFIYRIFHDELIELSCFKL